MSHCLCSLLLSGIRPQHWGEIFQNLLQNNSSSFELIFVGPKPPPFKLPKQCKYIKADDSHAKCVEIAFRHASGEYVIPIADDLLFIDKFLDNVLSYASSTDMDKNIIIPHVGRPTKRKQFKAKVNGKFHGGNPKWPIVGLIPLIKRQVWASLGGLDKRFHSVYWNDDIVLRFYQQGGGYVLANHKTCVACELNRGSYLSKTAGKTDWQLIRRLWHWNDKKFILERQDAVLSYTPEELRT